MRGGKMTGQDLFRTRSAADERESLELFIVSYYDSGRPPPAKIFTAPVNGQVPADNSGLSNESVSVPDLGNWFRAQFNFEPELLVPAEKHHLAILAMARQNALEDLRKRLKERGAGPALEELAKVLNLPVKPERIEGFDISHLDGRYPVASLISFKNGIPDRKNYRYYKLRSVIGVVDDYSAIREAVHRRYSRLIREGQDLPDLILIDGGIGQVNAAKGVMDELGMDIGVVALAKKEEELWLPNAKEPVVLSGQSEALKVLQFLRDETHRFAVSFNRRLRSKDFYFMILESVEGIGPKRAAAIMSVYGNIDSIAAASPPELAGRCKIGETSARAVCAAAKQALEDKQAARERLEKKRNRRTGELAAEAAADAVAEPEPVFD
jgi:excinuclease ABC subunit C